MPTRAAFTAACLLAMLPGMPVLAASPHSPAPPLTPTGAVTGEAMCKDFSHNSDQSWTATRGVILKGPNSVYPDRSAVVIISPYQAFTRGITYDNVDVAALLDKTCLKPG